MSMIKGKTTMAGWDYGYPMPISVPRQWPIGTVFTSLRVTGDEVETTLTTDVVDD